MRNSKVYDLHLIPWCCLPAVRVSAKRRKHFETSRKGLLGLLSIKCGEVLLEEKAQVQPQLAQVVARSWQKVAGADVALPKPLSAAFPSVESVVGISRNMHAKASLIVIKHDHFLPKLKSNRMQARRGNPASPSVFLMETTPRLEITRHE